MSKPKRHLRVIEQLRETYPGKWAYVGMGLWEGPDFDVQAYGNDIDECGSGANYGTYTTYHRTDTGDRVLDSVWR